MKERILYHGSHTVLQKPEYAKGKRYNDYGQGLYCTEHLELAKEWACSEEVDGYVNRYALNETGLRILNLSHQTCPTLNWVTLLLNHRCGRMTDPMIRKRAQWLLDHFLLDTSGYDVIIGYRADDSYFSFARAFVLNEISLTQLARSMDLGRLGEQYVLKSPQAFAAIQFRSYQRADHAEYYVKRKARDEEARVTYQVQREWKDPNGLYLSNLVQEEVCADDKRLQC